MAELAPLPLAYPAKDAKVDYVQFASVAHCLRPEGGIATPVALYRLDGVVPPSHVDVSVQLSTSGTLPASVELLDDSFRTLRRYGFDSFVRRGSDYSLTAFLNSTMQMPRYVVVAPDPTQAGKSDVAIGSVATPVPIVAGPVLFTYNAGSETSTTRPFVEGGLVRVTVAPETISTITPETK